MTDPQELTEEQLREVFGAMDEQTLREMISATKAIEERLIQDGPTNDDELWMWVKLNLGIEISRTPVCKGHDSPFDLLANAYFNRYPAILAVGNRGGGKTFIVALLHWLNSEFKPAIESATFGATESQSLRCYAHLKGWVFDDDGNRRPEVASSIMRETVWRKKPGYPMGSKVEVLAGTPEAVNGPHPQVAHGDEVELMRDDTWKESRNMAVSKTLEGGVNYPSQEILTSTRKSLHGRMQQLMDGITEAEKLGMKPDYKLVIWCIFEVAKEVPNCQVVNNEERRARLEELGLNPNSLCECNIHMKGKWHETGEPRLLKDVCKGRLFRSRGHLPYADVVQKFKQNDQFTWEAQQECAKAETQNNYLVGFSEERHGIRSADDHAQGFSPDPANGPIFMSVDWGGTNPHALNYYQLLDFEIAVADFYGNIKRIPEGALICFDEIYETEIGVKRLAAMAKAKEDAYMRVFGRPWKIPKTRRFADPQGKSQKLDFKDAGMETSWKTTRDFDTHIEWLKDEWWSDELIFFVIGKAPMFAAEAQSWQKDPNTGKQVDEFNHCMSNLRYCIANIRSLKRRERKGKSAPQAAKRRHRTATVVKDTRRAMAGVQGSGDEWRKRLGGPGLS